MRTVRLTAILCALCAGLPARSEEPVATLGKERAGRAAIEWNVHDIEHAVLGPIKYAVQKHAVTTAAGKTKVFSLAFVSCQKSSGKMAIELTNASEADPSGGLSPTEMPRLLCRGAGPAGREPAATSTVAAAWEVRPLGDTLARGIAPAELRRCASIEVVQNVVSPPGSPRKSQPIVMEITPYARALDAVFVACGEPSAYAAPAATTPAAAPARPAPSPAPAAAASPAPAAAAAATETNAWKPARTTPSGRTHVRSAASVDSRIVTTLPPGTRVRATPSSDGWWKVTSGGGARFDGYIRGDRLVLD